MIFGAAHAEHSLVVGGAFVVDELRYLGRAYECRRGDSWMFEDGIDRIGSALNDLKYVLR